MRHGTYLVLVSNLYQRSNVSISYLTIFRQVVTKYFFHFLKGNLNYQIQNLKWVLMNASFYLTWCSFMNFQISFADKLDFPWLHVIFLSLCLDNPKWPSPLWLSSIVLRQSFNGAPPRVVYWSYDSRLNYRSLLARVVTL